MVRKLLLTNVKLLESILEEHADDPVCLLAERGQ